MIFGEYFFKKKIRKMIEQSDVRKRRYCSLDEANSILVLFLYEDKDKIEKQLNKLRSLKKQVRCCITCDRAVPQSGDPTVLYINKSRDVDNYGVPTSEIIAKVMKIPADILIDLSGGRCHTLKVLMLQHPSLFKTGRQMADSTYYDFSIRMTEGGGTAELFEYLLFYLQTIRSK